MRNGPLSGAARSAILAALFWAAPLAAAAVELPTYTIELNNGVMTPMRLEVSAGTRFKIVLINSGTEPAEFESLRLRKEKVLAPGVTSFVVINGLAAGEYSFFDDFHLSAGEGAIVAR